MPKTESPPPLLSDRRRRSKVGETAGDCAAVWCFFPCAALHLAILAVYRLPVGIWRKKKRNRLLKKKRKHGMNDTSICDDDDDDDDDGDESDDKRTEESDDFVEWEKEMIGRFYGAGFWRSASQRTDQD